MGAVRQSELELCRVVSQPRRITKHSSFRYFKTSPEIIRLAAILYARFPLSLRNRKGASDFAMDGAGTC